MENVIKVFHEYSGKCPYLILFFIALLLSYTIFSEKRELFFYPSVCILALLFIPNIKKAIEHFFVGEGVYWRLWWLIPINLLIALVITYFIERTEGEKEKIFVITIFMIMIVFSGKIVFNTQNFTITENFYKIPNDILEISAIIEKDQKTKQETDDVIVAVRDVAWQLRIYDPRLKMLYGRTPEITDGVNVDQIDSTINSPNIDWKMLHDLLAKNHTKYLILQMKQIEGEKEKMKDMGYDRIGETKTYVIFRIT